MRALDVEPAASFLTTLDACQAPGRSKRFQNPALIHQVRSLRRTGTTAGGHRLCWRTHGLPSSDARAELFFGGAAAIALRSRSRNHAPLTRPTLERLHRDADERRRLSRTHHAFHDRHYTRKRTDVET